MAFLHAGGIEASPRNLKFFATNKQKMLLGIGIVLATFEKRSFQNNRLASGRIANAVPGSGFRVEERLGRRLGGSLLIPMHYGSGPGSTEYKVVARLICAPEKRTPLMVIPIASSVPPCSYQRCHPIISEGGSLGAMARAE